MEVFENGKNNQQPASKAEPARPGDGFTSEELYAKGEERRKAKDFSGALMWYEKAAEQGDVRARFCCGLAYSRGIGTEVDEAKGLMWYEKAAEQGDVKAQTMCSMMYCLGIGTEVDEAKGLMWCEKAAEQGDARAQLHCGGMYYRGEGTAEDKAKALMWCEKAAEQGNAEAQCWCGDMYYKGEGTAKDKAKALMWYEKAAEQGDARARTQKAQMQKYEMTQSHYEELQKELNDCKTTRTAEVKKRIYEARLLGDLSENEAYDKAKNEERCLCERIKKIEEILQRAVIVEESQD